MVNSSASASNPERRSDHISPILSPMAANPKPRKTYILNDRYRLLKILGRGGFGVTILAKDYQLPSHPYCVIKQLCPLIQDQETLIRSRYRFQREAKTLAALGGHAQIPLLLNYFEQKGQFFLVQEFIEGNTLTQQVKEQGLWTEDQVLKMLQNILPVIAYVHQQGVIHRDLKPSNIMYCTLYDRFVLLDFGAMKWALGADDGATQITRQFVGTAGFAPPEQQQLRPCFASDLYALGMTCLFLLSGRWPQAFPWDKRRQCVLWTDLVSVSDPFQYVLNRLLAVDLNQRYRSAEDVLKGIEQIKKLKPQSIPPTPAPEKDLKDLEACLHNQLPQRRYLSPRSIKPI